MYLITLFFGVIWSFQARASEHFYDQYDLVIYTAAELAEIDYLQLRSQLETENSRADPHAESTQGAIGCGQFLPKTWKWLEEKYQVNWSITSCRDSIFMTALYMKYLMTRCASFGVEAAAQWDCAIIAFNHGEGNLRRILKETGKFAIDTVSAFLPSETKNYLRKIKGGAKFLSRRLFRR